MQQCCVVCGLVDADETKRGEIENADVVNVLKIFKVQKAGTRNDDNFRGDPALHS